MCSEKATKLEKVSKFYRKLLSSVKKKILSYFCGLLRIYGLYDQYFGKCACIEIGMLLPIEFHPIARFGSLKPEKIGNFFFSTQSLFAVEIRRQLTPPSQS